MIFKCSAGRGRKKQPLNNINVTPFVDVMLVLLIVFMITSPMLLPSVVVDLPNTSNKAITDDTGKPVVVTVSKDNAVYIQDKQVPIAELAKSLEELVKDDKEGKNKRVFVRGDKNALYGIIVKVMGEIKASGFHKLAIVSDAEN